MQIKIKNNFFLKGRYYLLELSVPSVFKKALPGQFVHVRIEDSTDPLLRRPLSIHETSFSKGQKTGTMKILYTCAGKGTRLLSEKKRGNEIDCLGPLGHGFDLKKAKEAKNIFLIAGGIGVAPLFFLANRLVKNLKLKPVVLIGAKTKHDILKDKEFRKIGCKVLVATEDGSLGFKGRVTELLLKQLDNTIDSRLSRLYSCGPKAMLATVAFIADRYQLPAQVSLEEFMGCGIGACLGCVIKAKNGYQRICHDGPVFDADEIEWEE